MQYARVYNVRFFCCVSVFGCKCAGRLYFCVCFIIIISRVVVVHGASTRTPQVPRMTMLQAPTVYHSWFVGGRAARAVESCCGISHVHVIVDVLLPIKK